MQNSSKAHSAKQDAIINWFDKLQQLLIATRQRVLVSCQGSQSWCDDIYRDIVLSASDSTVISNRALVGDVTPFSQAEVLLGTESRLVVVDLYNGLNPDIMAIAGGLVKSGGMLMLLSEAPTQWPTINDQYAVWQNQVSSPKMLFIDYFFNAIKRRSDSCVQLTEGGELADLPVLMPSKPTPYLDGKTVEQSHLVDEITTWFKKSQQKIALITASRGRGKSVCLGFVAVALNRYLKKPVVITAYSRRSAAMLLAQTDAQYFVSPDQLIANQTTGDVLIIDEAAMLPSPMLTQLCKLFSRVVMATTTAGYEGTGQGFLLRFVNRWPDNQILHLGLYAPTRWSVDDKLEEWLDDCLMLKQTDTQADGSTLETSFGFDECEFRVLSRRDSQRDISLLRRITVLMVSAHYRTRPSDLRALMENPDLVLVIAECRGELVGVALLNQEGGFDQAPSEEIYLGKRRPKGHLLSQMLTAQAGAKAFATLRGLRIQRIAVLESKRRLGIGRQMIKQANEFAEQNKFDYIGACFAFESDSAAFWKASGYHLAHIGYGQGKSTGSHSVAVIKAFGQTSSQLLTMMQGKVQSSLSIWLCQYLQSMDAASVVALLRYCDYSIGLSELETADVHAFGLGQKGLELCFVSLQRFVMGRVVQLPETYKIHPWLIEKMVQNKGWLELTPERGLVGRKPIQNKLRLLLAEMMSADVSLT